MTFDELRKFALTWPEVEDGTSYGTPALKVRKKMLARLREDGDSLVMPGVPPDEQLESRLVAKTKPPAQQVGVGDRSAIGRAGQFADGRHLEFSRAQ